MYGPEMHWWSCPSQCDVKWRRNELESFILKGAWGVWSAPPWQHDHFLFSIHTRAAPYPTHTSMQYCRGDIAIFHCSANDLELAEFSLNLTYSRFCDFFFLCSLSYSIPYWTWGESDIRMSNLYMSNKEVCFLSNYMIARLQNTLNQGLKQG